MIEEAKQNVGADYDEGLLNVKFEWDPDHVSNKQ